MKVTQNYVQVSRFELFVAIAVIILFLLFGCKKSQNCDRVITMNGVEISRIPDYDISRSSCQFAVDTSAVMDTTIDCN